MSAASFLLRRNRKQAYRDALVFERSRNLPAVSPEAQIRSALSRLAETGEGHRFGTLSGGEDVQVASSTALMSALVIGATGTGKTRFILGLLLSLVGGLLSDRGANVEFELVDPKHETFDLLKRYLAALWLESSPETRERLAGMVRVIAWSKDAVSPTAPFDNQEGLVSPAYLAHLRTDITVQASFQTYTDAMRQALFMLNRLLVAKRFPPNLRFTTRLFSDAGFRRRVLEDVGDPDLRAFFSELERTLPRQTSEALLRRIQYDLSFPEIRLSEGIPPHALERLLPKTAPRIVLGSYSPAMALPASKGRERANHRVTDVLLRAPRRDPSRRGLLVIEEAPVLLSGSTELVEPLTTAARTLRSVGMGIHFCAQDFENALPPQLVRNLRLNSRWWAVFRSHAEAEWIYPHLLRRETRDRSNEADRHREFLRKMAGLSSRQFYLLVKGEPALPILSPDVPDPKGRSDDELRGIFDREIASRSMLPARVAEEEIAKWEADVVGKEEIPPSLGGSQSRVRGIRDLLQHLGPEEDEGSDE
jgi:hypothetical protein